MRKIGIGVRFYAILWERQFSIVNQVVYTMLTLKFSEIVQRHCRGGDEWLGLVDDERRSGPTYMLLVATNWVNKPDRDVIRIFGLRVI